MNKIDIMQRTGQQRKSLEVYCRQLSNKLNIAGYDQKRLIGEFKDGFNLPWTQASMKLLFREIAKAMYDVQSTSELKTEEMQKVYQVVDARISEITGVTVAWPCIDELMMKDEIVQQM